MKPETKKKAKYAAVIIIILTIIIVSTVLIIHFCVLAKDATVKDKKVEQQKKGVTEDKPTIVAQSEITETKEIKPTIAEDKTKPTSAEDKPKPTSVEKDPVDAKLDSHQRF